ncbi:efflux RND transporter periplasmic adaptor subunit [Tumidithrix elongata RA019]|uniref:Efflux RND transporter periplasmic adaptor subunit n=2 Tax=Tumidithrix TaxID=3088355 RepID=A0AAW9Q8N6_9CYAN|nr:efflux RND transporter periplasmic adaptor subunit [Tumidithrix elongata RA019]
MLTKMPRKFLPVVLAVSLSLGACGQGGEPPRGGGPASVKIESVMSGTVTDSSDYVASLQSRKSVTLQPRVDGQILAIYVKPGDRVEAGTPLLQIDPAKQQATVTSFNATVLSSQADVENARATLINLQAARAAKESELAYTQKQFRRYSDLTKEGATTQQALDDTANKLRTAQADLNAIDAQIRAQGASIASAETRVAKSEADVVQQEVQLQYYTIAAPFAGVVGDIPVKVGDYVSNATQLTQVTENRALEVQISVPVEKAPQLRIGLPVELRDGQDQKISEGTVSFISPNISAQTQSILVKANFDNSKNTLRASQFVRARVIWSTKPGILVPTSAIARVGGQDFIFVAETKTQEGKPPQLVASQKAVKLGKIVGNNQEVLEGLKPNAQIVVAGILTLRDGVPIMPAPPETPQPKK